MRVRSVVAVQCWLWCPGCGSDASRSGRLRLIRAWYPGCGSDASRSGRLRLIRSWYPGCGSDASRSGRLCLIRPWYPGCESDASRSGRLCLIRPWYPGCVSGSDRSGGLRLDPVLVSWLWIRCQQIRKAVLDQVLVSWLRIRCQQIRKMSACSCSGTLDQQLPHKGSNHFRFTLGQNFFQTFSPIVDRGTFCLGKKLQKRC